MLRLETLKGTLTSRGLLAASTQSLLTNVLILSINIATGIITARTLGPAGRGEQAAMQMWPQIFAMALTLGLPTAVLYNMKRYPERASQFLSAALLMGTVMGLSAILVGAAFTTLWLTQYSTEIIRSAQWLMLAAPSILLVVVLKDVLRAQEEFTTYNVVQFLSAVVTLLALVLLALMNRLTPLSAALSYLVTWPGIFIFLIVRLLKIYDLSLRNLRFAFRSLTSYGIRSYGVDLLGQLVAGQLDRVLVLGLLEPAAMGLYVVALGLSRTLLVFATAVARVALPKAAGRPLEEIVGVIGWAIRVSTSAALLAASVLAILGPWVVELAYGKAFLNAIPIFRLLLAETILAGATLVLTQALMASNRPGLVSLMQAVGVGLTILLLVVLVPRYGLVGAGIAMLIATTSRFVFAMVSFPASLGVRPPRLLLRWSDVTAIIHRNRDH